MNWCPLKLERVRSQIDVRGLPMESPKICERVRLLGDPHPFFVIFVDEERQLVDLMPVSGRGPCMESVPFSAVLHGLAEPVTLGH